MSLTLPIAINIDKIAEFCHTYYICKLSLFGSVLREDLDNDRILSLALVRLIEIIGEAANNISKSNQAKYSKIPWGQMIGMRNRLAINY
ncbi:MAG: HepT-like ribonuclease domain-containing protein [Crocosphaera sp.]